MFYSGRRGSVVLLAITVLALLFIVASALLMVSNQQRQTANLTVEAREMRAVHEALTQNVLLQLRSDVGGGNRAP